MSDDMSDGKKTDEKTNEKTNEKTKKILVLGSTGVGKSALCYNLGCDDAQSSDRPVGVTLDFHELLCKDPEYLFVDAVGFNEGKDGSLTKEDAIRKFINFCHKHRDGFNLVLLVQEPRKNEHTDKDYKLVDSLLSGVPIVVMVQRSLQDWPERQCDCTLPYNHNNGHHFEAWGKRLIIPVDMPGADVLTSVRWKEENTDKRFKRLEDDVARTWKAIKLHSSTRYQISVNGFLEGFKYYVNEVVKFCTGKVLYFTETMKRVFSALLELGIKREEAQKILSECNV